MGLFSYPVLIHLISLLIAFVFTNQVNALSVIVAEQRNNDRRMDIIRTNSKSINGCPSSCNEVLATTDVSTDETTIAATTSADEITTAAAETTTSAGGDTTTVGGDTTTAAAGTTVAGGDTTTVGADTTTTAADITTAAADTTTAAADTTTAAADTTTTAAATTTSAATTTVSPGYICPMEGKFPDPKDTCQGYYQCIVVNGIWYYYVYKCPPGTMWNDTRKGCQVGSC